MLRGAEPQLVKCQLVNMVCAWTCVFCGSHGGIRHNPTVMTVVDLDLLL